jgi:hypothetical protein
VAGSSRKKKKKGLLAIMKTVTIRGYWVSRRQIYGTLYKKQLV